MGEQNATKENIGYPYTVPRGTYLPRLPRRTCLEVIARVLCKDAVKTMDQGGFGRRMEPLLPRPRTKTGQARPARPWAQRTRGRGTRLQLGDDKAACAGAAGDLLISRFRVR